MVWCKNLLLGGWKNAASSSRSAHVLSKNLENNVFRYNSGETVFILDTISLCYRNTTRCLDGQTDPSSSSKFSD
jgi:hypothetical protein